VALNTKKTNQESIVAIIHIMLTVLLKAIILIYVFSYLSCRLWL